MLLGGECLGGATLLGVVVDLILLERLQAELGLMLACDMPSNGVVPCERARTERAWHPDPLMSLPDVRAQVRLVPVEPFAERTFELFS